MDAGSRLLTLDYVKWMRGVEVRHTLCYSGYFSDFYQKLSDEGYTTDEIDELHKYMCDNYPEDWDETLLGRTY